MGSEPTVCMCKMLVPEVLSHSNYRIWSSCMKEYLLGQGLWDVTEAAEEEKQRSSDYNSPEDKTWRRKDAKALHAIKMSCGKKSISKIMEAKSASEAWDMLRSIYNEDILEEDTSFDTSYDLFIRATSEGDWSSMELFMKIKAEAMTKPIFDGAGRTALHRVLKIGHEKVAFRLVNLMKAEDLAIKDREGVTALSYGVSKNCPGMIGLAKRMVEKNSGLPNIGKGKSFPVVKASWKGFKELTHYLYSKTDSHILDPQSGQPEGAQLLINCITSKMFDIASDLVEKFPSLVCEQAWDMSPAYALAKTYSPVPSASGQSSRWSHKWVSKLEKLDLLCLLGIKKEYNDKESMDDGALEFLKLVCEKISNFNNKQLREANVYGAMLKAAEIGNIDFILEMHKANSTLIWNAIDEDGKSIFWHAIANRQHKVYNLIYGIISSKESLLSCYKKKQTHNVLHLAAMLAPSHTLDQISGAALQMQRELQWFEEVKSIGKPRYGEDLNEEKLTPRQLFSRSHKELLVKGESELKETAKDSIIVGTLIVTIMFTVAFPDDSKNQNGRLPKIFIICDALSLFSSTTSVVVFLGLLISRYAEDDFLVRLPRKLMIGLCTLFFSIINMMIVFCSAVAIMLDGKSLFIIPVVLLACVPIILFSRVIVPQLCEIYVFTSGSIFDKNTRLPVPSKKQEGKSNTMIPDQV